MRLESIITTPNPNSMKLNFEAPISTSKAATYDKAILAREPAASSEQQDTPGDSHNAKVGTAGDNDTDRDAASGSDATRNRDRAKSVAPDSEPEFVRQLLAIEGISSVFVCGDFLTINRDPRHDWKPILDAASRLFSSGESGSVIGDCKAVSPDGETLVQDAASSIEMQRESVEKQRESAAKSGQVSVAVQTFKGVPIQVKVIAPESEARVALSSRFSEAAQAIQNKLGSNFLKERYWADWGVRYGDPAEIAAEVAEEIEGTIDEEALPRLVLQASGESANDVPKLTAFEIEQALSSRDWQSRLKAVQELGESLEDIPLLTKALSDDRMQVRRFAAAALGATGCSEALAPLAKALLEDPAVAVRRTAGDALSDIGDPAAEDAMCQALADDNKLVRWRAARYLAEVGTEKALAALKTAMKDEEFEVRLEAKAAAERILQGSTGLAPAWKRILEETV